MTTCSYTYILDDSQEVAMRAAIKFYLAHCEKELADGPKAPFFAHRKHLHDIKPERSDLISTHYVMQPEGQTEPGER